MSDGLKFDLPSGEILASFLDVTVIPTGHMSVKNTTKRSVSVDEETDLSKKKKRVSKACVHCSKSHMSCEDARPCRRCVDRNIAHLCQDRNSGKRRGRKSKLADILSSSTSESEKSISFSTVTPTFKSVLETKPTLLPQTDPSIDQLFDSLVPSTVSPTLSRTLETLEELPVELKDLASELFGDSELKIKIEENSVTKVVTDELVIKGIRSVLLRRVPEELESLTLHFERVQHHIQNTLCQYFNTSLFSFLTQLETLKPEVMRLTEKYKSFFGGMGIPTIVFDLTGVVYYINPSLRTLTGFFRNIPSSRDDFLFYNDVVSEDGLKEFCRGSMRFLEEFPSNMHSNSFIINCALRQHNVVYGKPIEGTLAITVSRDQFGLPFLLLGTFLPKEVDSTNDFCASFFS